MGSANSAQYVDLALADLSGCNTPDFSGTNPAAFFQYASDALGAAKGVDAHAHAPTLIEGLFIILKSRQRSSLRFALVIVGIGGIGGIGGIAQLWEEDRSSKANLLHPGDLDCGSGGPLGAPPLSAWVTQAQ